MAPRKIYLVTGANRGIGLGLTTALLKQPSTTVIGTVRDWTTDAGALKSLVAAPNSHLITVNLSSTDDAGAVAMVSELKNHEITHIDTIIASAGLGDIFKPSISTTLEEMRTNFEINTLGPIKLFQAVFDLLMKSTEPKFILLSSSLGSIGDMEGSIPSLSYGMSKAAANYFVRKLHFEHESLTAVAVHTGWVKTANGQHFANAVGVTEPPMELDECVGTVLEQVEAAGRTTSSGTFISYDGTVIKW